MLTSQTATTPLTAFKYPRALKKSSSFSNYRHHSALWKFYYRVFY